MRRRLFNLLAAVSLAVCMTTVILWMRCGAAQTDVFEYVGTRNAFGVYSFAGRLFLAIRWNPSGPAYRTTVGLNVTADDGWGMGPWLNELSGRGHGGFSIVTVDDIPHYQFPSIRAVAIPHWGLFVTMAMFLIYRVFVFARRRQRTSKGFCLACGYNLTGNVSGVCLECGSAVAANSSGEV